MDRSPNTSRDKESTMELMDHQLEAIDLLGSGKILRGDVGSGKSAAVFGYYMKK